MQQNVDQEAPESTNEGSEELHDNQEQKTNSATSTKVIKHQPAVTSQDSHHPGKANVSHNKLQPL